MSRIFNVTGSCDPQLHYMVDITKKLEKIKKLVDRGDYFSINRARQYGKTTTINALAEYIKNDYIVVSMDFQEIGNEEFENAKIFASAFSEYFLDIINSDNDLLKYLDESVLEELRNASAGQSEFTLRRMFVILSRLCKTARKNIVLIIDEVDSAANNQVFLDFLAQLRSYYLKRKKRPIFQSVILAGVYDVKNIKTKIRPESEHKVNSPWNIAAEFLIDILPEYLSGGVKTLLLLNDDSRIFNASTCGNNCAKWILRIAKQKDLTIRLGNLMNFGNNPFEIRILNNESIVKNMEEMLLCAHQFL